MAERAERQLLFASASDRSRRTLPGGMRPREGQLGSSVQRVTHPQPVICAARPRRNKNVPALSKIVDRRNLIVALRLQKTETQHAGMGGRVGTRH